MRMRVVIAVIAAAAIVGAAEAGTVLKVNGVEISAGQLAIAKYAVTYETPSLEGNDAEVTRRAVETLVNNVLLADAAQKAGLSVTERQVRKSLEAVMAEIGGRAVYEQLLARFGVTDAEVKQLATRRQLAKRYVATTIEPTVKVSEADARAFYDAHKDDVHHLEQIKVRTIFVNVPPGADAAVEKGARERIEKAEQRILAGEDFGTVAREVSEDMSKAQGGELGWIGKGVLPRTVEARVWALEPGDMSDIERGPFGFGLLEVLDKRGPGTFPFEEVRADAERAAFKTKVKAATAATVQQLRSAATIEALDPAVKAAL
jgi:parvulin-like peptidyl-prolyl isomerase